MRIRVILIKSMVCKDRYDYFGTVYVDEINGVIDLAGNRYCVGGTEGTEVFNINCFTKEQLLELLGKGRFKFR